MAPDAEPYTPPFDPTVCDAPPYQWLPPSEVGQVVTWSPAELPLLTLQMITNLIGDEDLGGLRPAHGARIYKLRYTTQDQGRRREATAMVGAPLDWVEDQPPPVALWLHGTSGFSDACAPSADLEAGIGQVALLATLGYLAIAPDFTGMLGFGEPSPEGTAHPYLVGESVALSSLDALRAALGPLQGEAGQLGYTPSYDRVIYWGASQGGHAAFFTERYQPYYAPELAPVAVAALVPPTDLEGLAQWGLTQVGSTSAAVAAAITLMWDWYGRTAPLDEIFLNDPPLSIADNIYDWLRVCDADTPLDDIDALEALFSPAALEAAAVEGFNALTPWSCYLRQNTVGHPEGIERISDAPFFISLSGNDTLVITDIIRDHLPQLCAQGYRLETIECAGLSHTRGARAALPHAHRWLQARLTGEAPDPALSCLIPEPIDCEAIP